MFKRFSLILVALITFVFSAGAVQAANWDGTNDTHNIALGNNQSVISDGMNTPRANNNLGGVLPNRMGPDTTTNNTTFRTNNLRTNATDNDVDWGWLGLLGLLGLAGFMGRNRNPENNR